MKKTLACLTAASLLALSSAAQAELIDTTASYTSSWQPFSDTDTATYGQTFTVGSATALDSFTLYLDSAAGTVDFKGYVFAWDGAKATGSALYASGLQQFSGSAPTGFTFNTGGLALTSGAQYVAFLSTSGVAGGEDGWAHMPSSGPFGSDPYAGGGFVYYNNGDDFSLLTSNVWNKTGGVGDVWFQASLSNGQVPEPATLGLSALALAGLGALRRRKPG